MQEFPCFVCYWRSQTLKVFDNTNLIKYHLALVPTIFCNNIWGEALSFFFHSFYYVILLYMAQKNRIVPQTHQCIFGVLEFLKLCLYLPSLV